jgi:hypothetical protein
VVKKRPARMHLRAMAMARRVLPVPVPPTRTTSGWEKGQVENQVGFDFGEIALPAVADWRQHLPGRADIGVAHPAS